MREKHSKAIKAMIKQGKEAGKRFLAMLNEQEKELGARDKLNPHIHCPKCQYPIYKSDFDVGEED